MTLPITPLMHYDELLDTSGLSCPLPMLRAKKALQQLVPGQVLLVISTDPSAVADFTAFAKQAQHELLSVQTQGSCYTIYLKKN